MCQHTIRTTGASDKAASYLSSDTILIFGEKQGGKEKWESGGGGCGRAIAKGP